MSTLNKTDRDKLLTVRTAHEEIGIKPSKTYYYIRKRFFKHYKRGKEVLFWKSDLLNFLEKHKVIPEQPKEFIVDDEIEL